MKKYQAVTLTVLALAALLVLAACAPATTQPTPAAGSTAATPAAAVTPVAATAAPEAAAPTGLPEATIAVGSPTPDARPVVPAPEDGKRPLADLDAAERLERFSAAAAPYTKDNTVYVATIVTDKGNIVAELYQDTPESLNNFVTLALNGFYDGLTFHRVEPEFVIQGGDPAGDGSAGPGYSLPAEIKHDHARGAMAWARTGDEINPERRSSGSQFYIVTGEASFLNGAYSVFGFVTEGMDVADKIAVGDKIQRIDVVEGTTSKLPTPTPSPTPYAPSAEEGRPLATVELAKRENYYNASPEMTIDTAKTYQATIETDKGNVVLDLDAKTSPITVNNFVMLANLGYYDGMPIAHVEPNTYMVLGSPGAQPGSAVGYLLDTEGTATSVITGSVAMYPIPVSDVEIKASGSQFFVALTELPQGTTPLNVFGKVSSGADVVSQLAIGDIVKKVTITEK